MRFSKFFVAALAPVGLFAQNAPAELSTPELIAMLEKHDLAIVPKSELTGALTELTAFLKAERAQPRFAPHMVKRQRPAGGNMTSGSGSEASENADGANDDDSSDPIDLPSPADFGNDLGGLFKGVTEQLADLPGLLRAVQGLLTDDFLDGFRKSMIFLAASLEPPIPNILQNLLKRTAPLMDKAEPLLQMVERLDLEGLVEQVEPLLEQVGPLLGELNKIDLVKLVRQITPLLDVISEIDIEGILNAVKPLLTEESIAGIIELLGNAEDLLTGQFVNQTHTLIGGAVPLIELVDPLVPELKTLDLTGVIRAAKPLLEAVKQIDVEAVVKNILPLLEPDSVKMLVGLVGNAGDLLTKKFVDQTNELIGDATPLVASAADLIHDLLKGLTGKTEKR